MSAKKGSEKAATKSSKAGNAGGKFSDEERSAVRDLLRERKIVWGKNRESDERLVLEKISQMPESDRSIGKALHEIVKSAAPNLWPRLWYGMPAYTKDGEVLCWYQPAHKFKARYGFLGFGDQAKLDEGRMWPISFALAEVTAAEKERVAALLKRALS